ncbi:MAG TPA: PIG-L family deacetylase [Chloroflexota bacterium]|nr:PIG-L family deacetylase [Chloroflexota bacterium]
MHCSGTFVAVHAHPDDECITTGGTLARFSAEGVRTVVITCTNGDAGPSRGVGPDGLAEVRSQEMGEAFGILGVARGVELGYADSGFPNLNHAESFSQIELQVCAEAIAGVLHEERPEVIVTYDADGGYGHPDHIRTHQATVLAAQLAAPRAGLYAVVFPRSVLQTFEQLMAPVGRAGLLGIEDMDVGTDFGTPDEAVSDSLDVSAYIEMKRRALAAHRSQMGDDHVLLRMPPNVRRQVWQHEYFRRLEVLPNHKVDLAAKETTQSCAGLLDGNHL